MSSNLSLMTVDMMTPAPLDGHALGRVSDDWEAVEIWLATVREKARSRRGLDGAQDFVSKTEETYRFHLAKLRWYCENVLRVTPSRWTAQEVRHFSDFLGKLPSDALCARRKGQKAFATDGEPGWTPFRGQPSASAQSDIKRFVHAMFSGLHVSGYIRINPAKLFGAGSLRKVNTDRAISLDLYELVLGQMAEAAAESFVQRQMQVRDAFIFEALRGLGLRATELVDGKMNAFYQVKAPKSDTRFWVFRVHPESAKGGKERKIPVPRAVWEAFLAYRAAFGLHAIPSSGDETRLLLSPKTQPVYIGKRPVKQTKDRRFFKSWQEVTTRQGLYKIVKKRLADTADSLHEAGRFADANRLKEASPHWLRHTFGKAKVAEGVGMRQLADALGHASVSTTMGYTEQDALDLIDAFESAEPGSVASESTIK